MVWQFTFKLVRCSCDGVFSPHSPVLLRCESRNQSQPHFDLDPSGDYGRSIGADDTIAKATAHLRNFDLLFPLPIKPQAAAIILSLRDFPDYEAWMVKFHRNEALYPRENYLHDLATIHRARAQPATYDALNNNLVRTARSIMNTPRTLQDRAVYARGALKSYRQQQDILEDFYDSVCVVPETTMRAMIYLNNLQASYTPEQRVRQGKKESAHPDFVEKVEKKHSKRKAIADSRQTTID